MQFFSLKVGHLQILLLKSDVIKSGLIKNFMNQFNTEIF